MKKAIKYLFSAILVGLLLLGGGTNVQDDLVVEDVVLEIEVRYEDEISGGSQLKGATKENDLQDVGFPEWIEIRL